MKRLFVFLFAFIFFVSSQLSIAHAQIFTTEKLITVDTGKQMVYAWEGGRIVNQSPVSTGMWLTPTVKGEFRIYRKLDIQDMRGPSPYKHIYPNGSYYIKNVPNVMYFYQAYAFHGAYWHNNFGSRASHGCVNQPIAFSKWLYDWAPLGTRVMVF